MKSDRGQTEDESRTPARMLGNVRSQRGITYTSTSGSQIHITSDQNDPYVAGCAADAYAVSSTYIYAGYPDTTGNTQLGDLRLMYSPKCNKNWTDMVDGTPPAGASIDGGVDGPFYIYRQGAPPPSDISL